MSYIFRERPQRSPDRYGPRLRALRTLMGLTVEEAAASAGLGVAAYVALECGRQRLTASVLMRVMRALQSPASLLFDLD